jgi:DNA-binding HxlR family transcriptional regulator
MKRTAYSCGLEAAFDVIGGKWKVLILWQLHAEPRRFGELKRLVAGVTEKMLIQQLREMEADDLIRRKAYPEIPPRVEYSLTPTGEGLKEALTPLCLWGSKHMKRIGERHLRKEPAAEAAPKKRVGTSAPKV